MKIAAVQLDAIFADVSANLNKSLLSVLLNKEKALLLPKYNGIKLDKSRQNLKQNIGYLSFLSHI
ncbi:MAG: hypothetical protein GX796_07330 [Clostridiaceae bacterium]|nr:hypothetical protein [Clostridiaceae bacterium]